MLCCLLRVLRRVRTYDHVIVTGVGDDLRLSPISGKFLAVDIAYHLGNQRLIKRIVLLSSYSGTN